LQWRLYIAKRGTLNLGMRMEGSTALLASILINANRDPRSAPAKMADFMPHIDREDEMSVDSVFKKLGGKVDG
jgi:hypothetical protein